MGGILALSGTANFTMMIEAMAMCNFFTCFSTTSTTVDAEVQIYTLNGPTNTYNSRNALMQDSTLPYILDSPASSFIYSP